MRPLIVLLLAAVSGCTFPEPPLGTCDEGTATCRSGAHCAPTGQCLQGARCAEGTQLGCQPSTSSAADSGVFTCLADGGWTGCEYRRCEVGGLECPPGQFCRPDGGCSESRCTEPAACELGASRVPGSFLCNANGDLSRTCSVRACTPLREPSSCGAAFVCGADGGCAPRACLGPMRCELELGDGGVAVGALGCGDAGLLDPTCVLERCPNQTGLCQGAVRLRGDVAACSALSYGSGHRVRESCADAPGVDDDCDGLVDEVELSDGGPSACAPGACAIRSADGGLVGYTKCGGGCSVPFGAFADAGYSTVERCGDGVDNDCDGLVDVMAPVELHPTASEVSLVGLNDSVLRFRLAVAERAPDGGTRLSVTTLVDGSPLVAVSTAAPLFPPGAGVGPLAPHLATNGSFEMLAYRAPPGVRFAAFSPSFTAYSSVTLTTDELAQGPFIAPIEGSVQLVSVQVADGGLWFVDLVNVTGGSTSNQCSMPSGRGALCQSLLGVVPWGDGQGAAIALTSGAPVGFFDEASTILRAAPDFSFLSSLDLADGGGPLPVYAYTSPCGDQLRTSVAVSGRRGVVGVTSTLVNSTEIALQLSTSGRCHTEVTRARSDLLGSPAMAVATSDAGHSATALLRSSSLPVTFVLRAFDAGAPLELPESVAQPAIAWSPAIPNHALAASIERLADGGTHLVGRFICAPPTNPFP